MKTMALPTLVLILAAGPAMAETRIDRTESLGRGGTVSVEMVVGELTIEGWSRNEVEITGVLYNSCEQIDVDRDDDEVSVEVDWDCEGNRSQPETSWLKLMIPRDAAVEAETVSASLRISGTKGPIEAETISGLIEVRTDARVLDLGSISGRIDLVARGRVSDVDLETVSGGIAAELDPEAGASIDAESTSGSITLKLPSSVSARFELTAFTGGIVSDFGPKARKTTRFLPSEELSFTIGSGSADIHLENVSGGIVLERR